LLKYRWKTFTLKKRSFHKVRMLNHLHQAKSRVSFNLELLEEVEWHRVILISLLWKEKVKMMDLNNSYLLHIKRPHLKT